MADFKGTADTISTIKEALDTIQTTLEDTFTRAETVQGILNDEAIWAGEAQLVGAAFLDLVVQYHGKLVQFVSMTSMSFMTNDQTMAGKLEG